MIQLQISKASQSAVIKLIQSKSQQLQLIVSPTALTEISKAVFTITAKRFLQDLSMAAKQDPARFHHLYEWGQVGNPTQKLFIMKRTRIQYGQLQIDLIPMKSNKPVPIPTRLREPGPTGRTVSAKHIFRNKMEIMENNSPIHIYTKKTIVFSPDGQELVFLPKDRMINISHPGGPRTTHALREYTHTWYSMKAPTVITQSRLIRQIANEVAKTVNKQGSNPSQVYNTIKRVNSQYSREVSSL